MNAPFSSIRPLLVLFAAAWASSACAPQRPAVTATTSTTAASDEIVPVPEPYEARVNPYLDPEPGDLACSDAKPRKSLVGDRSRPSGTCD